MTWFESDLLDLTVQSNLNTKGIDRLRMFNTRATARNTPKVVLYICIVIPLLLADQGLQSGWMKNS